MIILFGNQKGGCGKTTNCIQFANYLVEDVYKRQEELLFDTKYKKLLEAGHKKLIP